MIPGPQIAVSGKIPAFAVVVEETMVWQEEAVEQEGGTEETGGAEEDSETVGEERTLVAKKFHFTHFGACISF